MTFIPILLAIVSLGLFVQALFSLYLQLYSYEHPERLAASDAPKKFLPPQTSFTVLLPARHEEGVIYDTIRSVWSVNYPAELLEVFVICTPDDTETVAEAERAIQDIGSPNIQLLTYEGSVINKPRALNVGLSRATKEVVTIFDAEDTIDSQIFGMVNTVMLQEEVSLVQGGVQLMNFRDHWFGIHNCMEYFFWFKSRLHFHANVGMIPLGGNTVFVRTQLLRDVDGWDPNCLTEDCDLGIVISVLGEPTRVVYNAQHVTREETPENVNAFVKQRTRWSQGFLQVLLKGEWMNLPTLGQKLLALYTLTGPLFQAALMFLIPFNIATFFLLKAPVLIVIIAFLPLYALGLQLLITAIGAYTFTHEYGLRFSLKDLCILLITFVPFQWMIGVSAMRAVGRMMRGNNSWEKTKHLGAHRGGDTLESIFHHEEQTVPEIVHVPSL